MGRRWTMSTTSKSPRKVALVALDIGQQALAAYCHRFSPKVYTQPQLFACLVFEVFYKTDYRGITGILADTPSICHAASLEDQDVGGHERSLRGDLRGLGGEQVAHTLHGPVGLGDDFVGLSWPHRAGAYRIFLMEAPEAPCS